MKSEHQFPFFNTKEFIENRLIRGSSLLFEKIQTPPKKKRITQQNHNDSSQFLNQSFVNASEYSSFLIKNSYQNTSNKKQRSQSNHKSHNINFKQPKQQSISPLLKRSTPYDINKDIKLKSINESQLSNNNKYENAEIQLINESKMIQYFRIDVENESIPLMMKVVQVDEGKRWKELYYFQILKHPNILELKHYFINKNTQRLHMIFPWIPCTLQKLLEQCPLRAINGDENRLKEKYQTKEVSFLSNGDFEKQQLRKQHLISQGQVRRSKTLSRVLLKLIIYQIVRSVAYLHSKQIAHRDLNPSKFSINLDTLEVVINDFSSARTLSTGFVKQSYLQIIQYKTQQNYIGDPCYRAPELLLGATQYTHAIDLWSLACLIIEIYYGLKLFYGKQTIEILANIIKVIGTPSSDDLIKMKAPINQMKMPVVKRMGFAAQVQRFKNNDGLPDLLEGLLNYNPEQRTSAFELLVHPFFQEIKHQSIRMNQASLPNLFNFTKEELNLPLYNDNIYKLVPDWFKQKQKRNEYLQTNYEDALLILKN